MIRLVIAEKWAFPDGTYSGTRYRTFDVDCPDAEAIVRANYAEQARRAAA